MKVLLMPTLYCNYSCEYCYLQSDKLESCLDFLRFNGNISGDKWKRGLDWLDRNYPGIDSVDISGGEPFIHRQMVDIIKHIVYKYGHVNITSNLSDIPDEFFEIPPEKVGITVSLHLDENGKIRGRFLETMNKLRKNGYRFVINFVGYPKQLKKYEIVKNISSTFGCPCHLEPYVDYGGEDAKFGGFDSLEDSEYADNNMTRDDKDGIAYSAKRDEELKRNGYTECNIIGKYMVVVENGDVYPCFGMMFKREHLMANIFEEKKYGVNENPIFCTVFCPCAQNYRDGFR